MAPPIVGEVLRSPGGPLDPGTRAFMESRFGHDFSRVRVHTDRRAAESAQTVRALAYTVGSDIVFRGGRYAPGTTRGNRLLAHELTHVVQQERARQARTPIALADSGGEREADAAAEAVLSGGHVHLAQTYDAPRLARFSETVTLPARSDGTVVTVERVVTPGQCRRRPRSHTGRRGRVTWERAFFVFDLCRGRTAAQLSGQLDYEQVIQDLAGATSRLLNDLTRGLDRRQALQTFEQELRRLTPQAELGAGLRVGRFQIRIVGTGQASVEQGARGRATLEVGFDLGQVQVVLQGWIAWGRGQRTTGGGGFVLRSRTPAPDCYVCSCTRPERSFICSDERPRRPRPPRRPTAPVGPVFVPLFFAYRQARPRPGWERNYQQVLHFVVQRILGGYTLARIEVSSSPEGPLGARRGSTFEGNLPLAHERALRALADLRTALVQARQSHLLTMRDGADRRRRLDTAIRAISGRSLVRVRPELFGSAGGQEVSDAELCAHLLQLTQPGAGGEPSPQLVQEHLLGAGVPRAVRREVSAQIGAFRREALRQQSRGRLRSWCRDRIRRARSGWRRGSETGREPRGDLQEMLRTLRRALIVLDPPSAAPGQGRRPLDLRLPLDFYRLCTPEEIRRAFGNRPVPRNQLFEGNCRPTTGGGGPTTP